MTMARNTADKLANVVFANEARWGIPFGYGASATAELQALVDANPGKAIVFVDGTVLRLDTKVRITGNNTRLIALGRVTVWAGSGNNDALHFECPTTGQWDYLNECSLEGRWYFFRNDGTTTTAGAGLRLTRTGGFILDDAQILNWAEGLVVEGGKDFQIHGVRLSLAPSNPDRTGTADSALMKILEAPTAGGTYQPVYALRITNLQANANTRTQCTIFVGNADGLHITNGYIAGGKNGIIRFKNLRAGSYISAVTISDLYLDAVNQTTGANTCIDIPDDALASNVYNVDFSNCFMGNCVGDAVSVTKTVTELKLDGCTIANVNGTAVNFSGSTANAGNLTLTGTKIQSTGALAGASSAVRIGNAGSVHLVGNKIDGHSGTNSAIRLDGSIADATIVGNGVRMSSGTDFQNVGTVARLVMAGNNSNLATSALQGVRTGNKTNADPRVLDWYEEGTFTPTITLGGATTGITYTLQSGTYTRVGDRISFDARITLSSKGTATGNLQITGLPVTAVGDTPISARITSVTAGVLDRPVFAFVQGGSTAIRLDKVATAGATVPVIVTDTDLSGTFSVMLSGTYRV